MIDVFYEVQFFHNVVCCGDGVTGGVNPLNVVLLHQSLGNPYYVREHAASSYLRASTRALYHHGQ